MNSPYISETQVSYWFARGYYDGRAIGTENCPDGLLVQRNAPYAHAYRLGYDMGVSDHCDLDIEQETEG